MRSSLVENPDDRLPPEVLRSVGRRDHVMAGFSWSGWCPKHGYEPPDAPAMLVVTLPSGGHSFHLGLGRSGTPRCDDPGTTSSLGIGQFVPLKMDPPRRSRLPLHVSILGSGLDKEPPVARRGEGVHLNVRLRNMSARPFRFRSCPVYEIAGVLRARDSEVSPERNQKFILNCRSVGTIAPGGRVVFEIVARVPQDAQVGRNYVDWILAPDTYLPPWGSAPITVER
jgi:hypothetical protein